MKKFVVRQNEQDKVNAYFQSQSSYWKDIYADGGVNAEMYRNRHMKVLDWVNSLALAPDSKVLEIGCGAGFMSIALARRGFHVNAIDSVEAMVEQTRKHVSQAEVDEFVCLNTGDAYALAFEDESFDLVVALGVIPWLERPELAIQEMARVTKPEGYIILTMDNRSRLNFLLDPLMNPVLVPFKRYLKQILEQFGILRKSTYMVEEVFHAYHNRNFINKSLASIGFAKKREQTLGFGPFTLFRRKVIPEAQGVVLQRYLQRLANFGMPGLRFTGSQYLVLASKGISQPHMKPLSNEKASSSIINVV